MGHGGASPEQHRKGTTRAASFLSCVFHLKESRREDIVRQRPCCPVPNSPLLNLRPWLLQAGLQTFSCLPHKNPMQWSTDQPRTSSRETSTHCGGPQPAPRTRLLSPQPFCPAQRLLAHRCHRTLPAAGAGSRAGTEQRQVPPGIKPHSQLGLHMLPHQHQPLVTNWLCCPEQNRQWEVGVRAGA